VLIEKKKEKKKKKKKKKKDLVLLRGEKDFGFDSSLADFKGHLYSLFFFLCLFFLKPSTFTNFKQLFLFFCQIYDYLSLPVTNYTQVTPL